jgi:hypothetical protein
MGTMDGFEAELYRYVAGVSYGHEVCLVGH